MLLFFLSAAPSSLVLLIPPYAEQADYHAGNAEDDGIGYLPFFHGLAASSNVRVPSVVKNDPVRRSVGALFGNRTQIPRYCRDRIKF